MVERVNRYLTKGLKIMTNECDSVCIALEAILLLLYAWNLWKGCHQVGETRDWYLMHYSTPSVTGGQKHTHTLVPYLAQTSLGAWLLLAMNLPFQSITPPTSIGSSLLPQSVWNLTQRTLPHIFLPFAKSPSYLSRNTTLTIMSSSIPVIWILARTPLATLYLPAVPFGLMHPKNVSTNCPTNSLDLGKSSWPSKALCMSLNIAPHQIGRRKNMHQIYLHIKWS